MEVNTKNEIIELIKLAKFVGQRFDLVQAGGGNISLKLDGTLWVKASGMALSDLRSQDDFAQLNLSKLKNDIDSTTKLKINDKSELENHAKIMLNMSNSTPNHKPSIEAFFHVIGYKYVVHTHPILVNSIVVCGNARKIIAKLFPESLFVEYYTPGIELAIAINNALNTYIKQFTKLPQLIFLKNHGVIVTAENAQNIIDLYDYISNTLADFCNVDFTHYTQVNLISQHYHCATGLDLIAFLSEDKIIQDVYFLNPDVILSRPTSPDVYVYNGLFPCVVDELDKLTYYINEFMVANNDNPKIIILDGNLYFMAINIKKAREMESVFKFHLLALINKCSNINFLSNSEISYLSNWDAEKYRQKL